MNNTAEPTPRSVLDLMRGIQNESIDPTELSQDDRRLCVAHLGNEGYYTPEMAQILRVSDRTIERDKAAVRDSMSLARDPELAKRFAGQLVAAAELSVARIRRVTRDRDTPAAVKLEGERACFQIADRCVERLQSLGYLPTAAKHVSADVTHRLAPDLDALNSEIEAFAENERRYGTGEGDVRDRLSRLHRTTRFLLDDQNSGAMEGTVDDEPAS